MTPTKHETTKQRDTRYAEALDVATDTVRGRVYLKAIRAAVYSAIPGKQRKRAYMDETLEKAVKAACRALRRRASR